MAAGGGGGERPQEMGVGISRIHVCRSPAAGKNAAVFAVGLADQIPRPPQLFARAGYDVSIFDIDPKQIEGALAGVKAQLTELQENNLLRGQVWGRGVGFSTVLCVFAHLAVFPKLVPDGRGGLEARVWLQRPGRVPEGHGVHPGKPQAAQQPLRF